MADNSSSTGIIGVIIGAVLVLGLLYLVVGERMGISGPSTSVTVNAPKAPVTTK